MMNTGIRSQVIDEICALAVRHDMQRVILFGSRARGDFNRVSDIDLAVSGGNVKRFALDVEDLTSTLLTYDVVDLDRCSSDALLGEIQREGIILYEKV